MALPRSVIIVTCFGVLCSISIFWSFLQEQINDYKDSQIKSSMSPPLLHDSTSKRNQLPKKHFLDATVLLSRNNVTEKGSHCKNCITTQETKSTTKEMNITTKDSKRKRQIWISMGLCFNKNTAMYGKRNYPYTLVTPLAIILWYHFVPNIKVIIYLIYDKNKMEDPRRLYEET